MVILRYLKIKKCKITFQSYWRMVLSQKLAEQQKQWHAAATQIQTIWRCYKHCKWFHKLKQSVINFQAHARGYLARKTFQATLKKVFF